MSRVETAKQREENEIEFSRIVAFSDGVFAIAITLLVLQLDVTGVSKDGLGKALLDERQDIFAYAISFAVIGRFWLVHHRFFGDVIRFDGRLIALNLFYLAWIVLLPFSSQVLGDYGGVEAAVILYSINLVGVILAGLLMFADAHRAGLTRTSAEEIRANTHNALVVASVFAISIPVAVLNPHLAPYCWLVLFLTPLRELVSRARGSA